MEAAKGHPLYPMIDYIARTVYKHETQISTIEEDIKAIKNLQDELKQLINDTLKQSFSLKENGYEVCRSKTCGTRVTCVAISSTWSHKCCVILRLFATKLTQ